jgi:subfamily B ATP-binding cassette protein MsbA
VKTYFRILSFVKPYKKYIASSIVFSVLYAIANGASIYLLIPLLDTLFLGGVSTGEKGTTKNATSSILPQWLSDIQQSFADAFHNFIFTGTKIDALTKIVFLVMLAFFLKNLFGYLQAYFLAYAEQGVVKDIRNQAYKHLHKLPMGYFKNEKTGNLISRIINDVSVVQSSVSTVFLNMVREPITIIVFMGIALSISWQLTLFSFIVLPFSLIFIALLGIKLRKQSAILQQSIADITNLLYETISGVKIVKAFGMEEYENKKFFGGTMSYFKKTLSMVRLRNSSSPITEFLSVVVGALIIYYGGRLVIEGSGLKASEFLGFLFAIFQLMTPIKELSGVNNRIQESSAAGERIFEIIDTEPAIKNIENPIVKKSFNTSIKFENVSFHYDDSDELVLQDLNFEVKKGEIIALVGPSGGGKSTLVDLLPRFYDPTKGTIYFDDIDIKNIKIEDLRKLLGIVTQETILFNESIKSNIAYGLGDFSLDKIVEAAKMANAHSFIKEMPDGYETIIGERGLKISGGQRQRLSIARALLKNPDIMIFDEATSALDNESEMLVQEAIERLMQNRTTFVIAHRLSTIRNATKILVIEKGKIVQAGTHNELLSNESGVYKKLYEMQFRDV